MSYGTKIVRLLLIVAEILLDHNGLLSKEQRDALQEVRKQFAEDYREC